MLVGPACFGVFRSAFKVTGWIAISWPRTEATDTITTMKKKTHNCLAGTSVTEQMAAWIPESDDRTGVRFGHPTWRVTFQKELLPFY
jgi:hypothetical protein